MEQAAEARRPPAGVPVSALDSGRPTAIRANGRTPIATTSTARPPATSGSAPASTCASASCWRGSKATRWLGAFARAFASLEPEGEPTPLLNNTLRGWVQMPVKAMAA